MSQNPSRRFARQKAAKTGRRRRAAAREAATRRAGEIAGLVHAAWLRAARERLGDGLAAALHRRAVELLRGGGEPAAEAGARIVLPPERRLVVPGGGK